VLRNWTSRWFLLSAVLLGAPSLSAQNPRASEYLVPNKTVGLIVIANVQQLSDQFNKTQLGQLMGDPVMAPFRADLQRQLEQKLFSGKQLGLTLDDLRAATSGEVAIARIQPAPDEAALAVVGDITGRRTEAAALLEKISTNMKNSGATRSLLQAPECPDPIIQFVLPSPKDGAPKDDTNSFPRTTLYCLTGNLLCAADNVKILQGILARAAADRRDSLAEVKGFQHVMKRCAEDLPGAVPQMRWYVYPLGYAQAVETATPADERGEGQSMVEILENQGFEAVKAVGGFVDFASEGHELIHRTAIYAPPPYELAMKMFALPNGPEFAPQRWVPRDIATYSTFYGDLLNVFDHFDTLFDELQGGPPVLFRLPLKHQADLERGVLSQELRQEFAKKRFPLPPEALVKTRDTGRMWKIIDKENAYVLTKKGDQLEVYIEFWHEALYSLQHDPAGAMIDLRNELIAHLGKRVTILSDYILPITPTSERLLYVFETEDEEAVARAIEKTLEVDENAKRRVLNGQVIWEIVEEKDAEGNEAPKVGNIPSLTPSKDPVDKEGQERQLPSAAVTVSHGSLFIASHIEFLLKVLKPLEQRETLTRSIDYRRVNAAMEQMGIEEKCSRMFSRTDEEYRATYELIRQGKMPESETILGQLLNRMLGDTNGSLRIQQIDGEKMPDYDVVRRHLGPGGTIVAAENGGWFIKGFVLKRE